MSVKDVEHSQVFIDMKTKITSYGPHDGIIVYCGIQPEHNIFWPCVLSGALNSLSPQRFNVAPTTAMIHWPSKENNGASQRSRGAPYVSDRQYQLTDKDVASLDNFDTSEKVRLNTFEMNTAIVELKPSDVRPRSSKSYSSSTIPKIFNGGVPNTRKSLITAHNIDHYMNAEKAVKKDVSDHRRKEFVIHSGKDGRRTPITTVDAKLTPMKQFFEKVMTSCEYYGKFSDEFTKYCRNQTEKDLVRNPSSIEFPAVTIDPKIEREFTKVLPSQKTSDRIFLENLACLAAHSSIQQRQRYNSSDLHQVQLNHREVPEQLYHLYETQDAFGNLLSQL